MCWSFRTKGMAEDKDEGTLLFWGQLRSEESSHGTVLEINCAYFKGHTTSYLIVQTTNLDLKSRTTANKFERPPCGSGLGRVVAFE
jgi:hypothetical protein